MSCRRWAQLYRDWCVVGAVGTVITGFPTTPVGPLVLWAVILPAIAAWLLRDPPARGDRPLPEATAPTARQRQRAAGVVQARRRLPAPPLPGSHAA
jgi:hypothetical protein